MPLYSVETKMSPEDVVERAKAYFGEGGLGLSVTSQDPCCITLEGGGGHVSVTASQEDAGTEVRLETREWDYHVKKFMGQV
jgi:hypothetical protein